MPRGSPLNAQFSGTRIPSRNAKIKRVLWPPWFCRSRYLVTTKCSIVGVATADNTIILVAAEFTIVALEAVVSLKCNLKISRYQNHSLKLSSSTNI
eukprot:scaffold18802_cov83-Skeletonema_dohrnii-CCMP3373.AAC.3